MADGRRGLQIGANIIDRLLGLAASVLRATKSISKGAVEKHLVLQLVRSCTSAGANYEEARAAESKPDFVHKVGIASKEIRETIYWLRLLERAGLIGAELGPILREACELSAILGACIRTARRKP